MLRAALRLAETGRRRGRHLGTSLTNLADLYVAPHRYRDAEVLLRRAVAVGEARVGPGHPCGLGARPRRLRGGPAPPPPRGRSGLAVRASALREILCGAHRPGPGSRGGSPAPGPRSWSGTQEACGGSGPAHRRRAIHALREGAGMAKHGGATAVTRPPRAAAWLLAAVALALAVASAAENVEFVRVTAVGGQCREVADAAGRGTPAGVRGRSAPCPRDSRGLAQGPGLRGPGRVGFILGTH